MPLEPPVTVGAAALDAEIHGVLPWLFQRY
jgi:hypothetical protein